MRQANCKSFTFQTRLQLDDCQTVILGSYASLISPIKKKLLAAIASGKKSQDLKALYLKEYGITARQFNACRIEIDGMIASYRERLKGLVAQIKNRIQSLEKKIKNLQRSKKQKNAFAIHQKKRKLHTLNTSLQQYEADLKNNTIRLCIGSKKLFHAQFNLSANGYHSFAEWKKEWTDARNSSFFLVGSKDETAGNQSCVAQREEDGTLTLHLRLPHALEKKHGKYLTIPKVQFAYGHEAVITSLKSCEERRKFGSKNPLSKEYGAALNYRFKRKEKGWYLYVTTSMQEPTRISREGLGVVGVDLNSDHLAVTETDRFGNPISHKSIPLICYGKDKDQAQAIIHEAVKTVVSFAISCKKPLVIEKLDFQKKKSELKEESFAKKSRMLSSFAYSNIINSIHSRAFRFGIHVQEVNPAYTSVIGRVKFAKRYGLSIHESAALCIGRRYLGVSERPSRYHDKVPDGKGCHVTLSLPVRNRDKHVWHFWGKVKKRLQAVSAAQELARNRSSSRSSSTCCDKAIFQDFVGEVPTREFVNSTA
jgi:IS605 OrfB family transposase